ncbi:MAG: hypothetical protein HKO53_02800 [Gemmatimonadetes bacterium]|nr:hypothetical protein [Gemmatimonadota bacterium]
MAEMTPDEAAPAVERLGRTENSTVVMLDEGEEWEGEPIHWDSANEQYEAALDQADEQAEEAEWILSWSEKVDPVDTPEAEA